VNVLLKSENSLMWV